MSKQPLRSPPEVVESIQDHAARVHEAAVELTNRIVQFEVFLSTLKGRVDTTHFGAHPNYGGGPDELELAIRLHREGKEWVLSWSDYVPAYHEEHDMNWQLLKEAPLKIKIAAVKMFPDFLQAIEESQIRLAGEITEATAQFDAFANTIAKNRKERE